MFKSSGKLALFVLICFVTTSFLADLTIFPVEAITFTRTGISWENSLAFSEDVYSTKNTSVSDDVYTTPAPESSEVFKFPVDSRISDAISHPTEPLIFAADSVNSIVYSVNVETGTVREVYVGGIPERMDYFNDELFVTVLPDSSNPYWREEVQSGAIAIIDTKTMELKEKIDVDIDPFDIVVGRDGYLYVPSGSKQWGCINSYSRSTKELTCSNPIIYERSLAEYHPTLNRIYTMSTYLSPRDYVAYGVDNGEIVSGYDSPYHGDYLLTENFKISPDGKYIFNGSGHIFTCNEDKTQDMRFFSRINNSFNDIAFDLEHNLFFISVRNKQIYAYNYDTFLSIDSINSIGNTSKLFYLYGKLIALSDDGKGQLTLENIPIDNIINNLPGTTPTPTATSIPIETKGSYTQLDIDMEVKDSVVHPDKEYIYLINSLDELVKINFETGEKVTVPLGYISNCITFGNGEIYVGFGSQGMIGIYDADTLQYKDRIMAGDTFLDVAVGHDGYIYTTPNKDDFEVCYVKSFSRETKQQVSKIWLSEVGYLETNPINNSFIFSSMDVSPEDLYTIKYDNGMLTEKYDSPYHGEHKIGAKNKISPDGLYIFNNLGNIFKASDDKTKDLKFYFKLGTSFNDVAFDVENDKFYIATGQNTIYEYKYSTLTKIDTKYTEGTVQSMYFKNGNVIAVSRGADNRAILEKIKVRESPVKRIDFEGYTIKDSVIHDKRPTVYFVDNVNNKLVSLNYITGEINESKVSYSPNCLDIYNGEIYVGCGENGVIYIYDHNTLTLKEQIISESIFDDMGIGNDGFIYIIDDRCVKSISRISKKGISKMEFYRSGKLEKHPTRNAFYFTSEGSSSPDIYVFEYDNGNIISLYDSLYRYDFSRGKVNRISPDGKLLFNSSGNIFTSSINRMYDIKYMSKLENSFIDVCFDEKNNLLFSANTNTIDIYDYSTLTKLAGIKPDNKPNYVFYKDDILLSLASDSLEIKTFEELSQVIPPTPTPPPAPGIMLPSNAAITDAVEHPEKPVIFAVDAVNSKVYSVNIETGVIKETFINGAIERLDYQNDTLYVTVLVRRYSPYCGEVERSGAVVIIDADTMEIEDQFKIDFDPFDIVAGRDEIIYVPSGSGQWTYINSYSPASKQLIDTEDICQMSFAELHPTLNRIYTINTDSSPRDYTAFVIDNGEFVSFHDSPYHGDYKLATNFKISPDGKYLFNGTGAIFTCSEDVTKDMNFAFMLDKAFEDIAFNMEENKFYISVGDNQIYVYNYEEFSEIDAMSSIGEISKVFYVNGKLCALSKNTDGRPMFEIIEPPRIKYGDVNQDGEVDSTDITYLKGYILKKNGFELSEYGLLAADVDGDGIVDSLDLTYIKRYLLRKISEFPANNKQIFY